VQAVDGPGGIGEVLLSNEHERTPRHAPGRDVILRLDDLRE
jgi:hypothetical protein